MSEPVLVILMPPGGDGLSNAAAEALGAGSRLAGLSDASLVCAVIGQDIAAATTEAAERGVDRVLAADEERFARPGGDLAVAAAAAAVEQSGARNVLLLGNADALELGPRLAARLDGASLMGVIDFSGSGDDLEVTAAVFGGAAHAAYRLSGPGPRVLGLAPAVAEAPEREAGRTADIEALTVPAVESRVTVEQAPSADEGPRLEDARVVVSGGRGLKDGDNYDRIRELAEALGGMPGASRAIVDDGWAPAPEQVGLTGKIVTPDLYIAAGISGASQHMAGCSNSRVIVAINTDPDAPIFNYAHYGIVDDCLEVLPELTRLGLELRAGR
ncbi:MAG: electron transfer flavoprotein subunit alpha/FixB family protein [Dehalococcoidia bacterium]|jgi:electron transfer flavoprotein alpha subunit|nr:electron transfer flavoprotein subunit alpha/FixB family protein [Dehalococcoidia bacterium]